MLKILSKDDTTRKMKKGPLPSELSREAVCCNSLSNRLSSTSVEKNSLMFCCAQSIRAHMWVSSSPSVETSDAISSLKTAVILCGIVCLDVIPSPIVYFLAKRQFRSAPLKRMRIESTGGMERRRVEVTAALGWGWCSHAPVVCVREKWHFSCMCRNVNVLRSKLLKKCPPPLPVLRSHSCLLTCASPSLCPERNMLLFRLGCARFLFFCAADCTPLALRSRVDFHSPAHPESCISSVLGVEQTTERRLVGM